jgi:hypothetical protein
LLVTTDSLSQWELANLITSSLAAVVAVQVAVAVPVAYLWPMTSPLHLEQQSQLQLVAEATVGPVEFVL